MNEQQKHEIGENFARLRKEVTPKLSQEQLANIFLVNRITIVRIENGNAEPDIDLLKKYIEYFGKDAVVSAIFNVSDNDFAITRIRELIFDPTVLEIRMSNPKGVFVYRGPTNGDEMQDIKFTNDESVREFIRELLELTEIELQNEGPLITKAATMPDGAPVWIHAVLPPVTMYCCLVIRKGKNKPFTYTELINKGTISEEAIEGLSIFLRGRINCVIFGHKGSGRSSFLGMLSTIPQQANIIGIGDPVSLQIAAPGTLLVPDMGSIYDSSSLNTQTALPKLVASALDKHPDYLIIDECHGPEFFDIISAFDKNQQEGIIISTYGTSIPDVLQHIEIGVKRGALPDSNIQASRFKKTIIENFNIFIEMRDNKVMKIDEVTRNLEVPRTSIRNERATTTEYKVITIWQRSEQSGVFQRTKHSISDKLIGKLLNHDILLKELKNTRLLFE